MLRYQLAILIRGQREFLCLIKKQLTFLTLNLRINWDNNKRKLAIYSNQVDVCEL